MIFNKTQIAEEVQYVVLMSLWLNYPFPLLFWWWKVIFKVIASISRSGRPTQKYDFDFVLYTVQYNCTVQLMSGYDVLGTKLNVILTS